MIAMLLINHVVFGSGSLIYPMLFFCVWVYCRQPTQRNTIADVFGLFKMPIALATHSPSSIHLLLMRCAILIARASDTTHGSSSSSTSLWALTPFSWLSV
jgi:hypothetical protein